jgi:hypothetical protein
MIDELLILVEVGKTFLKAVDAGLQFSTFSFCSLVAEAY